MSRYQLYFIVNTEFNLHGSETLIYSYCILVAYFIRINE